MYLLRCGISFSLLLLIFSACSNRPAPEAATSTENSTSVTPTAALPTTPEEVAIAFCKAISSLDSDKAYSLSTEETHQILQLIFGMAQALSAEERAEAAKESNLMNKATCTIKGETASCMVCCNAEEEEQTIDLVKVDNKWLVKMAKEEGEGLELIDEGDKK